jgi:hypothetical protein
MENDNSYQATVNWSWNNYDVIKIYVSPADPTTPPDLTARPTGNPPRGRGVTSYSANWFVFGGDGNGGSNASIPKTFVDGTSNTIVFAERYCTCQSVQHIWSESAQNAGPGSSDFNPEFHTFALPQIRPSPTQCNPSLLQTPFTDGIVVGLGDGGVRMVSSTVSQATWTAALTPQAGDILGPDW